jgi:hypothetical protein
MENINYPLQESIQHYVNGELDDTKRRALLEKVGSEADTAEELAFSQSLALALRNRELVAASVLFGSVIAAEGFPPAASQLSRGLGKLKSWIIGTALVALLSVVAYFVAEQQGMFLTSSQKISRSAMVPLDNVLYVPADGSGLEDLQSGMAAYDAKDYKTAATALSKYSAKGGDNAARVYLGISRLLTGQEKQAIQPLALAAQSVEPPIQEAALWYLSLAYLANDQPDEAQHTLRLLPVDGIFGEQRQELLKKMSVE